MLDLMIGHGVDSRHCLCKTT